ncbi:hypothetical protein [Lysinibacillus agricola]|uniref:hypothetical protein n=1 Tax=Lysinibacillus agricola TaxID=2590012 RepID=UPI003C21CF40
MSEQVNNDYFEEIFNNVEVFSEQLPDEIEPTKKKRSITVIQIPNSIIKNKNISVNAFAVYVYLKCKSFRERDDKIHLKLDHKEMRVELGMKKDNRPLIAAFQNLYQNGLIKEEVLKMPIHSPLNITLLKIEHEPFTQLPIELIGKIPIIKSYGLKLLYYYESFINRKQFLRQFAFPCFETIQEDTGLNHNTINKYNKLLVENKLLKIDKHKVEQGDFGFEKWNNHYFVLWDKMIN